MSDITDYSKNYQGALRGAKFDTLEAETSIDTPVLKINGTAIKTPVLSGEYTTTGGDTTESATITGVEVGDLVIASLKDAGTNVVSLLTATENTADTVDFTFSADPGADAIVSYLILR